MRSTLTKTSLACAALLMSASLHAGTAADGIQVNDAYVRAVPPGQSNSAAFMSLTNNTASDHALIAAQSEASEVVELHTHTMDKGMMKMRRVDKIDLPSGEAVALEPGGLHVMLIGLKEQLSPGQEVDLTLVFEDDSSTSVTAPVKTVQQTMMHSGH